MLTFTSGIIPAPTSAADNSVVSVYVDGDKQVVSTTANTVGEVLRRAGIAVDSGDVVEPGLDEPIASQVFNINIYRARDVLVVDGDKKIRTKSAYQGPRLIVEKSTGIKVYPEDEFQTELVQDFITESHIGLKITIDRATPVKLTQSRKTLVLRTQAETVEGLLKEKEIAYSSQDKLNVPLDTKLSKDMKIVLVRVGHETVSQEKVIPRPVETILDNNQPVGYQRVRDEGKDGVASVTYEVIYHDGKEVKRKQLSRVVTAQPQAKVVVRGNKQNAYTGSLAQWLHTLKMCESGGNYQTNTGNGFFGAYQFMISTWDRIAPKVNRNDLVGVRPDLASPADQDFMIIQNTKLSAGGLASQNPGCYQKHGLAQFPPSN